MDLQMGKLLTSCQKMQQRQPHSGCWQQLQQQRYHLHQMMQLVSLCTPRSCASVDLKPEVHRVHHVYSILTLAPWHHDSGRHAQTKGHGVIMAITVANLHERRVQEGVRVDVQPVADQETNYRLCQDIDCIREVAWPAWACAFIRGTLQKLFHEAEPTEQNGQLSCTLLLLGGSDLAMCHEVTLEHGKELNAFTCFNKYLWCQ